MVGWLWNRVGRRAPGAVSDDQVIDKIWQAAGPIWLASRIDAPVPLIVEAFMLDFPDHPLTERLKARS